MCRFANRFKCIYIPSQLGGFNNLVGKVKTGLSADLVLLSKDFFSNSQDSVQYSKPLSTMSGGKWVYKNDNIDIDIN